MPSRTKKNEASQDVDMRDAPPAAQVKDDDQAVGEEVEVEEEEEEEEEVEPQRVRIVSGFR